MQTIPFIPSLKPFRLVCYVKYFSKAKKFYDINKDFYNVKPSREKKLIALIFGKDKRKIKNLMMAMRPIDEFNGMIIYHRVYFN